MTEKPKVQADSARPVGPEYRKGGDPAHSIFPENRPRDETGSTPPTAADAKAKSIENERIAKEQAQIKEGFANQPTAGHGREKDQGGGRSR